MTIFNQVSAIGNEWSEKTGYAVSGNMVVAVTQVIQAADPRGASTDDAEFVREQAFKILNAALLPANEKPPVPSKPEVKYFTILLARIPTNFSNPFKVAIAAMNLDEAETRLWKLYDSNIFSTYGYGHIPTKKCFSETADRDVLASCSVIHR